MRALRADEIRDLMPMRVAIDLMKEVFAAYSRGETISPIRTPVNMPDGSGAVLFMPAFVPALASAPAATGAKVVSVFGGNRERGLPTINAIVVLVDPSTGVPIGLLEGASVTALRTGAVSGAATDLLARADSHTLAIIGAGAQGVTQAAAVCAVRQIDEIVVYDVFEQACESFVDRVRPWLGDASARVRVASSAEDAVRNADVICTATTATSAVFEDGWVRSGVHINAVGAYTPEMQEIPDATIARSRIVVDAVEAVLHEGGDLIQAIGRRAISSNDVSVELGHVVSGDASGRASDEEITFFKSVGNAIQDMVVAGAVMRAAESRGVGQVIELG